MRSTSTLAGSDALASIKPSLGASGAIYATVTLTAMAFPEAHVSLIFPPTPPIPIQYAAGPSDVDGVGNYVLKVYSADP